MYTFLCSFILCFCVYAFSRPFNLCTRSVGAITRVSWSRPCHGLGPLSCCLAHAIIAVLILSFIMILFPLILRQPTKNSYVFSAENYGSFNGNLSAASCKLCALMWPKEHSNPHSQLPHICAPFTAVKYAT